MSEQPLPPPQDEPEVALAPEDSKQAYTVRVDTSGLQRQLENSDISEAEGTDTEGDPSQELQDELDPDAEYIDLTNRRLDKLPDLGHLKNLEDITLRLNHLTNESLAKLAQLPAIKCIDLYENRLTHFAVGENPFSTLTELEELDLSFNQLRFTRGLHGLKNMKRLYLIENKITRIDPDDLKDMPQLEILELGSNRLRVIENLEKVPSITQLFLGRNKITRIENLSALTNLRLLSLQSNRIVKIENLDALVNLEELYLSHNGITKIENLDALTNLKTLDLSGNRIRIIENIAHLTKLVDLWLNNNLIQSLDSLSEVAKLPALEVLYLEQNPVCNTLGPDVYRARVLELLPNLQQLDADYVEK